MSPSTVVVTGATGGIGSAICHRLAADGYAVVIGYNSRADRAEELSGELPGAGHRALRLPVLDSEALAETAEALASDLEAVDALINCAGYTEPVAHDDLDGLTDEIIDRIFQINWRGPFATIRAFKPLLLAAADPVVVNISSVSGVTGQGSNVAYCASKAALDSMTRSLARAFGPRLRVVSVSPGWVRGEYADRMPAEVIENQEAATPLGRLATPQDVASAVRACIGDLVLTTGSIIPVDGGRPLGVL